jgi:Raf kinase inhibitor-like YbhB/YbcL family protein
MRIATTALVVAAGLAGALAFGGIARAEPFTLTSASFKDGGMLQTKNAGNTKGNANCVGENISPDLRWSNAPVGVKSFVLVASDWEGQGGLGSHHLVAYGIAPSVTGFAEGELSKASDKFTGGKESSGTEMYRGPCPPAGTGMHHYLFNVIVTDLEPGALPAGLTRAELFDKLKGHAKGVAGIVALFGRN